MATIFIVDDESAIVEVLSELLNNEGHQVVTAPDGLTGFDILCRGLIPQIIFMDLFLPGINGRDFIEKIRRELQLQQVPIFIMTGANPEPSDLPPQNSYQGVIHKPFNLIDIIEIVDQTLVTVA